MKLWGRLALVLAAAAAAPLRLAPRRASVTAGRAALLAAPGGAPVVAQDEAAKVHAEMKKDAEKTLSKVKRVDVIEMMRMEFGRFFSVFFPGVVFRPDIFAVSGVFVAVAVAWLSCFFGLLYENDRKDLVSLGPARDDDNEPVVHAGVNNDVRPDLVIVFHHPDHEAAATDSPVDWDALHQTLVADVDCWLVVAPGPDAHVSVRKAPSSSAPELCMKARGAFVRGIERDGWVQLDGELGYVAIAGAQAKPALELVGISVGRPFARTRCLMKTAYDRECGDTLAQRVYQRTQGYASPRDQESLTIGMARKAFLEDLRVAFAEWGCDVSVLTSVDKDELFVCVSLKDESLHAYLLRNNSKLQLRSEITPKLGIRQDPAEDASRPGFYRYDPRIVSNLHKADVLHADDPKGLFRTHYGRDENGCIVSGTDRFRLLYNEICNYLDLDAARHEGLIADWYPSHSQYWLAKLFRTWGSFTLLRDFSFVQPIQMVHDYFGDRVAFNFAWNGLYCKALFALAALSLLIEFGGIFLRQYFDPQTITKRIVLGFSLVIIIWSRMTANRWNREHEFFMQSWELDPHVGEEVIRPSFYGEKKPSPADLNLLEKQYPAHQSAVRRLCSSFATLLFCGFVGLCIIVWTNIFDGRIGITASISLAVMICVFEQVYNMLVPTLTDWENHKYQYAYYDSLLWKQFLFQSVNRYAAFFYIAVQQRLTDSGCPADDCVGLLHNQLVVTLLILSMTGIVQVIVTSQIVRLKIWYEDYKLRQSQSQENPDPAPERSFVELQGKFAEYRMQEQIQHMLQLVLSLGFVLFFGPVAPIIVPFCLGVFTVLLRGNALLILSYAKRSVPRQQFGIGQWGRIVSFLMNASVLFSAFLVVVYGDLLANAPLLSKVAGALLYTLLARLIWALVDAFYPPICMEAKTLRVRRQRVHNVLIQRAELSAGELPAATKV